jgi:hypothetical protein
VRAVLLLFFCGAVACGGEPSAADDGAREDDFAKSDFREDATLPYAGDWLDVPRALSGVGQFDRLKGTVHDDAKCSTMVALAAAIVGGRDHFLRLVAEVARIRASHADDVAVTKDVRDAVNARALTARHLHSLTEVVVRAYGVENGAYDSQIAKMVRASGYEAVGIGSKKPADLVASLENGEIAPLATIADNEAHITLLWKDARGTVRLYDSDDIHGSHVLPRGSSLYNARVNDPQSAWDRREKYRLP